MALTKNDIIDRVIDRLGVKRKESVNLVEQLIEIMKLSLENEDHVLISGFGKFVVRQKNERNGRNPATGKAMMLKKRKVVTFQHSIGLKDKMNKFI